MSCTRRNFVTLASAAAALGLSACTLEQAPTEAEPKTRKERPEEPKRDLKKYRELEIDMKAWNYDADNDVWYQLELAYCITPGSTQYESLSIYVPGPYLTGKQNGKKYSCEIAESAQVGEFTAATAPIVMPINSSQLSAQACPSTYSPDGLWRYLEAGFIYVYAGFRGRSGGYESSTQEYFSGGAPWAVTDLKAAVRYLRYNAELLPGNSNRIFTFGYGGGGGYSALMGTTGNAEAYEPYLEAIGAAAYNAEGEDLSDETFGSASWCPLTSFDSADSAYEWMMGQYSTKGTRAEGTWTALLSKDLAAAYAAYINDMDLRDQDDKLLTLDRIDDGSYMGGSYYSYLLETIEHSAEQFFKTTSFPYTVMPATMIDPCFPGDPNLKPSLAEEVAAATQDGGSAQAETAQSGVTQVQSTVYDSAESYLTALNGDDRWITYNSNRGSVDITGIWDFVKSCKPAKREVGAFDSPDRSSAFNQFFGIEDETSLHFNGVISGLISQHQDTYARCKDWKAEIVSEWSSDLLKEDALETPIGERVNMSNPLYYLSGHYAGFGEAKVAPHWRINSGLFQTATALSTEINLKLALEHYEGVEDVAFQAVWGKGYELAEQSGEAEDNFVAWVISCCSQN